MNGRHRETAVTAPALAVVLASLCGCSLIGHAYRPDPAVEEILRGMPAEETGREGELSARLVGLGPAAILDVCRTLTPPGRGDDTAARYALSGLAGYVNRPDAGTERAAYAGVLMTALGESDDPEVKAFLIRQLQRVGGEESVIPLGRYLTDERLCEPATQALLAIGTEGVEGELLRALESVRGRNRVTVVKALGEIGSRAAAFEIWKFTASNDEDLRDAALYALANIGPVSTEALLQEAARTSSPYERSRAVSYQLLYAGKLAELGRVDESARICRELIRSNERPGEEHIRIAALTTLVEVAGEAATGDLLEAVRSRQSQVSGAVLRLAASMPGISVSSVWLEEQACASTGIRTEIREMLRDRNRRYPDPAVEKAIGEWETVSRPAAWVSMDSLALVGEGFRSLFNGVDLTGWQGDTTGYLVEEGRIVVDPERPGGSGNLYTAEEFDDFVLRFQFRLTPGANNGLGIRAPLEGDAAYLGMELQILDNSADRYAGLRPYQYHGSVYGVVPARRGFQRPVGEWNTQEVIADSTRIRVILNGVVIVDADIDEASAPQTADGRDHPGLLRERGHIGFLGHGSRVEFRKIWIKELD